MKVVINQSNYLPWKGYFDLIHDADVFIFFDDVQFTKNDWRNRNKIKTTKGTEWITIPVGSDENRLINEVLLPVDRNWATKHWNLLKSQYRTTPFFPLFRPFFEDVYVGQSWRTLSELNQYLITTIARDFLGIMTRFVRSEEFRLTSKKQERVIDLLKAVGATTYISGPAAKSYLMPERFQAEGVDLVWKDYSGYAEYPQFHPPFVHAVSVVDLLFQTGPAAADFIWGVHRAAPDSPATT